MIEGFKSLLAVQEAEHVTTGLDVDKKAAEAARMRKFRRENPDKARTAASRYAEKHPEKVKAMLAKCRDDRIRATPVIHDADKFDRIQEVMSSYKERKGK